MCSQRLVVSLEFCDRLVWLKTLQKSQHHHVCRDTQHSPSTWAGFAPLLTVRHSPLLKQNPSSDRILVLRHALTDPFERVRAIAQHDTVVQFLANAIVALHDILQKLVASSMQWKHSAPTLVSADDVVCLLTVCTYRSRFGQWVAIRNNAEQFPDARCRCCGSCDCYGSLLADFRTWSLAVCRCELTAEPKSQNIATTCLPL